MNAPLIRHRHKPKRPLAMTRPGAFTGALQPALAGDAPSLGMPAPESARESWIAGSVTTAIHAALFAVLFLLAWMAPPLEVLIPVKIIRELPGSNEEPAPARKILKARPRRAPVQAARRVTAQAVTQPKVVKLSPAQMKKLQELKALAPDAIKRRTVVSKRTAARSIDRRVTAADLDLAKLALMAIPTEMIQVDFDATGPTEIDFQALEQLKDMPQVEQIDYASAAPFEVIDDGSLPEATEAFDFDVNVGAFAGGNGTGGTGTAIGVVRCMESAYVQRYLEVVKSRTQRRWKVPANAPDDSSVKLYFAIDASGTATRVAFVEGTAPLLGNSAVLALREASPFPPMDDNVRCLAGKGLSGTFYNEPM